MAFSHKVRVGVLRGGPSPEYDVSLNTGKTILANLPEEYEPIDVFISKDGAWHLGGKPKDPYDIIKVLDVAFNAMHGFYGEDGTVQKFLESFGLPYTGSNSIASALGMNKVMSKKILKDHGLKTPHHVLIEREKGLPAQAGVTRAMVSRINENLLFPIIIKPVNFGSSLGVFFVDKVGDIKEALTKAFTHSPILLVEEYIDGKEATCGVIEGFRGQNLYTLLPVEILQNKARTFYDYNAKYNPHSSGWESRCKIPGNFKEEEKTHIQEATALAHEVLGLRHYSRSDFIVHPKRGLFILEVNTLPELSHRSTFIKSLEAVGGNIKEFLSHLLSKTLAN